MIQCAVSLQFVLPVCLHPAFSGGTIMVPLPAARLAVIQHDMLYLAQSASVMCK